jgi:hypothetical protein
LNLKSQIVAGRQLFDTDKFVRFIGLFDPICELGLAWNEESGRADNVCGRRSSCNTDNQSRLKTSPFLRDRENVNFSFFFRRETYILV